MIALKIFPSKTCDKEGSVCLTSTFIRCAVEVKWSAWFPPTVDVVHTVQR